MKNSDYNRLLALLLSLITVSCSVVEDIFKAGMTFGIFIVVAIIVAVIYIIMRFNKNR